MRTEPVPVFARLENIKLSRMTGDPLAAERARGDLYREVLELIAWDDVTWDRLVTQTLLAEELVDR